MRDPSRPTEDPEMRRFTAPQAKVQSLLPRKLKGIATATAIACAVRSPSDAPETRASSTTRLISSAATLTARKRAAWKPGWPSPGLEGPVPVPEEVVGEGDAEGADRGEQVVQAEVAGEHREDRQVDQVAGAADDAELEQLQPARRPAGGGAEAVGEFVGAAHRLLPWPRRAGRPRRRRCGRNRSARRAAHGRELVGGEGTRSGSA